jgi:hypothetical protein
MSDLSDPGVAGAERADGADPELVNTARGRRALQGKPEPGEPKQEEGEGWRTLEHRIFRFVDRWGWGAYQNPVWAKYTRDGVIPYRVFVRAERYLDSAIAHDRLERTISTALGYTLAKVGFEKSPALRSQVAKLTALAHPVIRGKRPD